MIGLLLMVSPSEGRGAEDVSDAALIERAQRGDVAAFGALHTRYYKRLYHLAYLKTNNAQDAEDVASETFVRALAGLSRFRLPGAQASFYPWLHRIALNLIVDGNRQRPPSGVVSLDAPAVAGMRALLDSQEGAGQSGQTPHEIAERHEVQQLVRAAIAALPPDQGDVLVYRFLGELSAREIAPLLGRSEAAVKSLLHRAVVALRREIERRMDDAERLDLHRAGRRPVDQQEAREGTQHVGRS